MDIGRHWPQRVCVCRGKSRKPESGGAESRECQQDILIGFRQNNPSLVSVLGLFNTHKKILGNELGKRGFESSTALRLV